MGDGRQSYTLDEIKDMLLGQVEHVVYHYAPPTPGSYEDKGKGKYFTLNPGRADRSVGSFVVTMTGAKAGKWQDFATGQHGDILDLIALNLGCSLSDAVREARAYLGLQSASPEDLRRRKDAAERARQQRQEAARREAEDRERYRKAAHALWLSGRESLRGTPVEFYLRDRRGIDLARIGRQPRALRYVEACRYKHMDKTTGEIIQGEFPAMVAIVNNVRGEPVACHRTYLAFGPDGLWSKAPVPKAKKVLGDYAGAWINIWTGAGPRGGKGAPLSEAAPGTVLYVTEGIEDALSVVMLMPEARVVCGISLSNLGGLALPPAVAEVVLVADQDESPGAREQLGAAVAAHQRAGRRVRVWRNTTGGKDLNDALRAALAAERGAA